MDSLVIAIAVALVIVLVYRINCCIPRGETAPSTVGARVKTMIFFGSGGHTMEMIRLIKEMDAKKYQPVCFAIGHTDITSIDKVRGAQVALEKHASWLRVFRNREVKQSWFTTFFTSIWSLIQAFIVIFRYRPRLLICNGPGTCLSLCYSAFVLNVLGWTSTRIVFVESFCRVKALSLTGKLMLPISDKFIVQWPELEHVSPRAQYLGVLC